MPSVSVMASVIDAMQPWVRDHSRGRWAFAPSPREYGLYTATCEKCGTIIGIRHEWLESLVIECSCDREHIIAMENT